MVRTFREMYCRLQAIATTFKNLGAHHIDNEWIKMKYVLAYRAGPMKYGALCQTLKWGPILLKEKLMKNIICYLCILNITWILIFKHCILTYLGISYMLVANGLRSCGDGKIRSKICKT
jgi:hypothetical protein